MTGYWYREALEARARAEAAEARVKALTHALEAFIDWGDAPAADYSDLVVLARVALGVPVVEART